MKPTILPDLHHKGIPHLIQRYSDHRWTKEKNMNAKETASFPTRQSAPYLAEILRGDPLGRLLRRFGVTPFIFSLATFVYSFSRTIILPTVFGHLYTVKQGEVTIIGALNDWPVLIIEMIMVPVVAGYYLWQPNAMQALYEGISIRIGSNPLARARAMEYVRPLQWTGWVWLAMFVGLFEAAYIQYVFIKDEVIIWETVNPLMNISYLLVRFAVFYMLIYIIVRQIFTIIGLNRFFSEISVQIVPLHPDGAGGWRILGDYVLSTAFIIGAVGLYFGMGFMRRELNPHVITTEFYILLTVYFILAPLFFFLPLIQAHRRMREAKKKLLLEVAEQFDLEYKNLLNGLKSNQVDSMLVQRVEAVQKMYKIAQDASEWPFNHEILSKFSAATLLPVVLPILAALLQEWFFP